MRNRLVLCYLLFSLTSCATGFRSAWRDALAEGHRDGVEGAWEGTWLSHFNGHTGKLRCVVGPDLGDGEHQFHYFATWKGFLSAGFRSRHRVVKDGGSELSFSGYHDMPKWAGGRYSYRGRVDGVDFRATYRSSMDNGVFSMKRVSP
jgi:hypothetical protein